MSGRSHRRRKKTPRRLAKPPVASLTAAGESLAQSRHPFSKHPENVCGKRHHTTGKQTAGCGISDVSSRRAVNNSAKSSRSNRHRSPQIRKPRLHPLILPATAKQNEA
ncbi:hypothetical protein KSP40_PGU015024 [Platanthera guangdongensis]|uniref:Uncharacterized protein n=1 Tax=Platanthera guangdongensis TaxID=2320717 RepID=A0ABR2M366_9ASPA